MTHKPEPTTSRTSLDGSRSERVSICIFYAVFIFLLTFLVLVILFISFTTFESTNDKLKPLGLMDWTFKEDKSSEGNATSDHVILNLDRDGTQLLRGEIIHEQGIKVARFLGVRYAHQPLRFQKSQMASSWSGVQDALTWPPHCTQKSLHQNDYLTKIHNYNTSEDCLFLNVWTPHSDIVSNENGSSKSVHHDARGSNLLPVIVFIHGGGFSSMGVSMQAYDGGVIAALGKVVYVTLNYRVGLLGFLNNDLEHIHKQYIKNAGLYDQMLAIQWVRNHIQMFGGNPNAITLQGQSAGAISIGLHMLSPMSHKLFQRAILQSGSPMMNQRMFKVNSYDRIIDLANCTVAMKSVPTHDHSEESEESGEYDPHETALTQRRLDETRCLEKLSIDQLIHIECTMLAQSLISFGPSLPSKFFPTFADEALDKDSIHENSIAQHEILLGSTLNESTLYLYHVFPKLLPFHDPLNLTRTDMVYIMQTVFGNNSLVDTFITMVLREITRDEGAILIDEFFKFMSDFIFKGPVLRFATSLARATTTDVYLYLFDAHPHHYPKWMSTGHWSDVNFVFGMPFRLADKFTDKQREFSNRIIQTWTNFARTGKMLPQLGIRWPALNDSRGEHMNLAEGSVSLGANLSTSYYDFFEFMYESF